MRFWNDTIFSPVPSDAELADLSKRLGVSLPGNYARLLQEYNGAKPLDTAFDVTIGGKKHTFCIDRFLGILGGDVSAPLNAFNMETVLSLFQQQVPLENAMHSKCDLLPIMVLFDGDLVCLDYRQGEMPSVCIWFHEESQANRQTYPVADSFEGLIEKCYEEHAPSVDSDVTLCNTLNEKMGTQETPYGYIWHFTEKPGQAQLVPLAIHLAFSHTGGRAPGMWGSYR